MRAQVSFVISKLPLRPKLKEGCSKNVRFRLLAFQIEQVHLITR